MKLIRFFTGFIIAVFIITLLPIKAVAADLAQTSKSAVLLELVSGDIVYEKAPDEAMPPASITKIMTILLIYEAVEEGKIKWDDKVTVSEHAASMGGSQVFLEAGEEQTVKELTKCIVIASANDAAVAMAEFIGGSEDGFVDIMNERAKELKMENTHFVNACGLDAEGHVSSARDVAIMSRQLLLNHPEVTEYTTTWMDTITHKTRRGESDFGLTNTNKLIKWYNGATGLKTGSTNGALYCLSGSAKRNGVEFVAVVMGVSDPKVRFKEVMDMLDYGFANYEVMEGIAKGDTVGEIAIHKGITEKTDVEAKEDFSVVAKKGEANTLEYDIELLPFIKAPFEAGEKAGEIVYRIGEKEVGRVDVITVNGADKMGFIDMFIEMFRKCA
ncbi:MAG: D-alanyl-D-alanine carboxypeptidase [Lachnospiraceae bacterium]|nr:D-alanyl-D-alanine carboxypeptidase [Lachnospiraceae bacterium]